MVTTKHAKAQIKNIDASNLIHIGSIANAYPEHVLEVRPRKIEPISLGEYTSESEPKSFTVEIVPKECASSVITHIARVGATYDTYDLILHVANYSDRVITAEVIRNK